MQRIQTTRGTDKEEITRARFHLAKVHKDFEHYIMGELDGDFVLAMAKDRAELEAMIPPVFPGAWTEQYRLYAKIRPNSKYAEQQRDDESPFPITLDPDNGAYCIRGNGNAYRREDVDIYAAETAGRMILIRGVIDYVRSEYFKSISGKD